MFSDSNEMNVMYRVVPRFYPSCEYSIIHRTRRRAGSVRSNDSNGQ